MRHSAIFSALAIAAAIGGTADARAQEDVNLDALRASHAQTAQHASALAAERDRVVAWAESRYAEIAAAHAQQDDRALRVALREAQVAADSLAYLDRRLAAAVAATSAARAVLARALEFELERTLAAAEAAGPSGKVQLTEEANRLAAELGRVQRPSELPAPELPLIAVAPTDGPEEIELKADFLADRAAKLRSAAGVVADEITRLGKRAELRDEIRRLVAEVRLFDQAGLPPRAADAAAQPVEEPSEQSVNGTDFERIDDPALEPPEIAEPRPFDVPVRTVEGGVGSPRGRGTTLEQLAQLRADLLARARTLEREAEQIRRLLDSGR